MQFFLVKFLRGNVSLVTMSTTCSHYTDAEEERKERVDRVSGLLSKLEKPPTLAQFREAFALEPDAKTGRLPSHKQVKAVPDICLPWRLPNEGKSCDCPDAPAYISI